MLLQGAEQQSMVQHKPANHLLPQSRQYVQIQPQTSPLLLLVPLLVLLVLVPLPLTILPDQGPSDDASGA